MDDFTQRLLEKKNARKRKQEEAAAALKNISLSSDVKKSPIKSRNPLIERNEVATRDFQKNPKPTPRTNLSSKMEVESRNKYREHTGKQQSENLAKKPPTPKHEKGINKTHESKVSSNGSESIQDRMSRLRNQSHNFEDDIGSSKKKHKAGLDGRSTSRNENNIISSNKNKVEKSSGSVSERLAMFEGQKNDQSKRNHSYQSERSSGNVSKDYSKDYKSGRDSNNDSIVRDHQLSKVRKSSSRKYTSPVVAMRINSDSIIDQSCSIDFDSDENPFDVSAILKEADAAEQRECQQEEYAKSTWSVTDYLTDDSPKVNVEKNLDVNANQRSKVNVGNYTSPDKQGRKRESVYSVDENGAELSAFGKQIAKKQRAIKSPNQQASLAKIDDRITKKTKDICAESSGSKHQQKLDQKVEKRKAPRCPEEDLSAKAVTDLPKGNEANNPPKKEKRSAARDQSNPPPKPARKNKDIKLFEAASEMIVENELPIKNADVEKKQNKEDRKKRAREEQDIKIMSEDIGVGEMAMQKEQEKDVYKIKEDSPKRQKQVDKVLPSEDSWSNSVLQDIDEHQSLSTAATPSDPAEMVFSPNSKTYKSVREKKSTKSKKTMRRSMSFSEGQPPQMHKSGYNEEASSRYNVVTTCMSSDKEENVSNSEKIKDLLDYAVSQQNIVIQASQALNMGLQGEERKGSPEIVEGERLLLLATERRTACLNEVERLKHDVPSGNPPSEGGCQPCKANLLISDIKLPLNGDFLLALRAGRMDLGVFHFVVLIQYGPKQIYSTKVRCTYDELSRNFLTFTERIELKDIPHDFVLTIKVFGMHTKRGSDSVPRGKKQQTKDSPGLMKNVFSSLTPRRRVNSADDSPVRGSSPKPVFRTTSFTPCGITQVNLAMAKSGKHALTKVPKNCPLEGFVEMNVDCQPQFTASARGFLTILEEVGEFTAWNRRWCVMQGDAISFWRFPDEETSKPSVGSIDLTMCANKSVDMVPRMECSRPNTFELIVKKALSKNDVPSLLSTIQGKEIHTKHWASADNKEDRVAWIDTLNRQLSDSKAWSVIKPRAKVYQPQNNDKTMSPRRYPSAVAV